MFSSIELHSNMKDLFAQQQLSLFLVLGSLFYVVLRLVDKWKLLLFIVTLLQAMLNDRSTQTISNSLHWKPQAYRIHLLLFVMQLFFNPAGSKNCYL